MNSLNKFNLFGHEIEIILGCLLYMISLSLSFCVSLFIVYVIFSNRFLGIPWQLGDSLAACLIFVSLSETNTTWTSDAVLDWYW